MTQFPIKPLAGVWAVAAGLTMTAALVIAALTVLGGNGPGPSDLPGPLTPAAPAPLVVGPPARAPAHPRGRTERAAATHPVVVVRRHVVVVRRPPPVHPKPRRHRARAHHRHPARRPPARRPRPSVPVVTPTVPVVAPAAPAPPPPTPAVLPATPAPVPPAASAPAPPTPEIELRLRELSSDDGGRWVVAGFDLTGPTVATSVELRLRAEQPTPGAPPSVTGIVDVVRTGGLQLRVRAGDAAATDSAVSNAVPVTVPLAGGSGDKGPDGPVADQLLLSLDGEHEGDHPLLGAGATTVEARLRD